jgi:hypothetical protein
LPLLRELSRATSGLTMPLLPSAAGGGVAWADDDHDDVPIARLARIGSGSRQDSPPGVPGGGVEGSGYGGGGGGGGEEGGGPAGVTGGGQPGGGGGGGGSSSSNRGGAADQTDLRRVIVRLEAEHAAQVGQHRRAAEAAEGELQLLREQLSLRARQLQAGRRALAGEQQRTLELRAVRAEALAALSAAQARGDGLGDLVCTLRRRQRAAQIELYGARCMLMASTRGSGGAPTAAAWAGAGSGSSSPSAVAARRQQQVGAADGAGRLVKYARSSYNVTPVCVHVEDGYLCWGKKLACVT